MEKDFLQKPIAERIAFADDLRAKRLNQVVIRLKISWT